MSSLSLSPFVEVQLRLHAIETASTAVSHVDVRRPHHQQHAGCDFAPTGLVCEISLAD